MSTPFQLGSGAPSAYSEQDVLRYLERIGFIDHGTKQKVMPPPTMATLSRIMLHHLSSCPFENTVIHYDPSHQVVLSPEAVFQRIVVDKQGGYCMQHNLLALNVLRRIGYRSFSVTARVNEPDLPASGGSQLSESKLNGPTHMVNLVSFPCHLPNARGRNSLYMVDIGFGGPGAQRPLLVRSGHIETGRAGEQHRLVRARHEDSAFDAPDAQEVWADEEWKHAQTLWLFQHRVLSVDQKEETETGTGADVGELSLDSSERIPVRTETEVDGWNTIYAISLTESFEPEYEVSNYYTGSNTRSIFVQHVLAAKSTISSKRTEFKESDLYSIDPRRLGLISLFNKRVTVIRAVVDRPDLKAGEGEGEGAASKEKWPDIESEGQRCKILHEHFGLLDLASTSNSGNDSGNDKEDWLERALRCMKGRMPALEKETA